jgi:hypothetical protein
MEIKTRYIILAIVLLFIIGLVVGFFADRHRDRVQAEKYQSIITGLKETNTELERTKSDLIETVGRARATYQRFEQQHREDTIRITTLEGANKRLTELAEYEVGIIGGIRDRNTSIRTASGSINESAIRAEESIDRAIGGIEELIESYSIAED